MELPTVTQKKKRDIGDRETTGMSSEFGVNHDATNKHLRRTESLVRPVEAGQLGELMCRKSFN